MKSIAVFCGSKLGRNEIFKIQAEKLADIMAEKEIQLVYGGGDIGLMGVIADGILERKGKVIGVIPKLLEEREVAHHGLTELIFTKTMSERKVIMSKLCNAYLILAGGFGTLDELFEALTMNQLGIEQKPVGILNTNGFYNFLFAQLDHMVENGFVSQANRDLIIIEENPEILVNKLMKITDE